MGIQRSIVREVDVVGRLSEAVGSPSFGTDGLGGPSYMNHASLNVLGT